MVTSISTIIFARTLLHFVNCHCDSMESQHQCVERLLANHLCHNLALRLVRCSILIADSMVHQADISKYCQYPLYSVRERAEQGIISAKSQILRYVSICRKDLFFHCIDLINDQNDRHANALELLCNVAHRLR